MKKFIKILLSLFLVFTIVAIAAPYIYKDEIVGFIKKDINNLLNARVDFKEVEVSFFKDFPNFHLQLNEVSIDGIDDFKDVQLLYAKKIGLSLDTKSVLFDEKKRIDRFTFTDGELNLKVLADGKANYDILKSTATDASSESTSFDIQLKDYEIKNTNLTYSDDSNLFATQIKNLNHKGKGRFTTDLYQLNTQSTIDSLTLSYDGVTYLDHVFAKLNSDFDISDNFSSFTLKNTKAELNQLPVTADGNFKLNDDETAIDLTYKTKDASLVKLLSLIPKSYMPDLKGVTSTGIAKVEGNVKGKSTATLIPGFTTNITVKNGTLQYPDLPEKVENINASTSIRFEEGSNLDNMIIELHKIQFDITNHTARGNVKITQLISDPFINTNFKTVIDFDAINKAIKIKGIHKLQGLLDTDFSLKGRLSAIEKQAYDKFKASGYLKLENFEYKSDSLDYEIKIPKATMSVKPESLQIENFDATIGESDFNLKGSISNYIAYALGKDDVLLANIKAHSKYINVNDFMDSTEAIDSTESALVKIPKNIDITVNSSADKVTYTDMDMQDVKANLKLKDEKANLTAVFMKSMGGNIMMNGIYDTTGDSAKTDVSFSMDKMPIKESATVISAFQAYAPLLQNITGQFFSKMDFSVDFDNQMNPILKTVNAKGNFKTNDIYPKGVTVLEKIGSVLKVKELTNAKIDKFNASFKIKNGVIDILPVSFKLNEMNASFQGDFNLDKELNFDLFLDVPRKKLGANVNQILTEFVGGLEFLKTDVSLSDIIKMKFEIRGLAMNPKIKPILLGYGGETLVNTVTEIVEDKINDVKNEALEKAQAQADKIMQLATAQKEKLVIEAQKAGEEVKKQAMITSDRIMNEAGDNPLKQMAAKVTSDKLKKEAAKQAIKLVEKAEKKGDDLLIKAQTQADAILLQASKTSLDSIK